MKFADGHVTARLVADIIVSDDDKVLEIVKNDRITCYKVGDITMRLPHSRIVTLDENMIVPWVKCIESAATLGVILVILGVIIMAQLQVVLEANDVKFPGFLQEVVKANGKVTQITRCQGRSEGKYAPNVAVGGNAGAIIGDDSQVLRHGRDLVVFNDKQSVIQANECSSLEGCRSECCTRYCVEHEGGCVNK